MAADNRRHTSFDHALSEFADDLEATAADFRLCLADLILPVTVLVLVLACVMFIPK